MSTGSDGSPWTSGGWRGPPPPPRPPPPRVLTAAATTPPRAGAEVPVLAAGIAVVVVLIVVAVPEIARPVLSVFVAVLLGALLVEVVRRLRRRDAAIGRSAFTALDAPPEPPDLPSDLAAMTLELRRARPKRWLGGITRSRLRTRATERLWWSHHLDVRVPAHHARLAELVSPQLFALVTDIDDDLRVTDLSPLVTEVERL